MSQATNPEARQAPTDVAQSLFWDDVRAGLKLVSVGVVLLLVGEIGWQFRFHAFLVGAIIIVGAMMTVVGLLICTAIPKETGQRTVGLLAAGCAALGTLALLVYQFYPGDLSDVAKIAVVLGAAALVFFALFLRGAASYICHRPLIAAARLLVPVATGFAVILVLACMSEGVENPVVRRWIDLIAIVVVIMVTPLMAAARRRRYVLLGGVAVSLLVAGLSERVEDSAVHSAVRLLIDLLAIAMVAVLAYVAWGVSDAILRCRLGQPLEAPRYKLSAEYLAAEEQRLARENIFYVPPPPPHFSENEVRFFHADDSKAAAAIVVLMAGIFTVGVVLYLVVAWSVVS